MADTTDGMNVSVVVQTNGTEKLKPVATGIADIGSAASQAGGALPKFYQGVEEAGLKSGGAVRGMRRLEYGLTAVATQSLSAQSGLVGASARMAEAGLLFGYGSEAVLGVGAGFAAFGLTLKAITAPLEAVEKGATKLTTEYGKLTASLHPGIAAMEEVLATTKQLADIQEAAQPTFMQELLGTGVLGLLGDLNGVRDQIDAQQILAHAAEATEKSLRPVLAQLVAIGETKDVIKGVGEAMRQIGDVGGPGVAPGPLVPHAGILGLDPKFDTPSTPGRAGTGLIGAQEAAIAKVRAITGSTKAQVDAAVETIDKDLVAGIDRAFKRAGDEITPIPMIQGMLQRAVEAIRASGVAGPIADEMIDQLRAGALRAIEVQQSIGAPVGFPTDPTRTRLRPLGGFTVGGAQMPTMRGAFGEPGAVDITGPDPMAGLNARAISGLSAVNNLRALDTAAEKTAKELDKLSNEAEKFGVTMTRTIGNALLMLIHSGSGAGIASGALAAGSSILGTLSQQRFSDADEMASHGANVAGSLKMPGLALPATIMSVGAGLISGFADLFKGGLSIKDYGPVALEQLRALMVQGGLVSMNITNGGGLTSSEAQNLIARNTSRDSIPRFPMQPAGAGR